jgi:PAS domain S-box-containing protein
MARLVLKKNWRATPLGRLEDWPPNIRTALGICLNSRFPILLWIGPELRIVYNDAYIPFLGPAKHPAMLGAPGQEAWAEIWPSIAPMHQKVAEGRATFAENFQFFFDRSLRREEVYVTFSYSPILDETGRNVLGVFCACTETTEKIVRERRLSILSRLEVRLAKGLDDAAACQRMADILSDNPWDISFAAIYLTDAGGGTAHRAAMVRLPADSAAFPALHSLAHPTAPGMWPLREVARTGDVVECRGLEQRIGAFHSPLWPESVDGALIVPLSVNRQELPAGFVIFGISPRRVLDEEYGDFLRLAASHIANAIADTRALESERRRAEALAQLDHAKTTFFSNVSHEFRTPLTLLLNPLEQVLRSSAGLAVEDRDMLALAHRNGMRLLRLVNTLLDFARIEAGRASLVRQPTDIARSTAELAASFQSLCKSAGLALVIDCPAMAHPVLLDGGSWEKIVLNLLSNAFKFTLEGEIRLTLRAAGNIARLTVTDTGCGIPAEELPRIFERFHRIEGQASRSVEGSGIGLALVQELVRLNGGSIQVASAPNRGTAFTLDMPLLVAAAPPVASPATSRRETAAAYAEEAARWISSGHRPRDETFAAPLPNSGRERILLADGNADMREYLTRLLSPRWEVDVVADGNAALDAIRRRRPDLLISDVIMPGLDGLQLVAAIRADPALASLSVILLSARAGEEARVEGLSAGADVYIVKPFAAQELIARVNTTLSLGRLRRMAAERAERAETRLRAAIDLAGLSPYAWDPVTDTLEWDDRIRAMWGLPPGAPVDAKIWMSAIHSDDRPKVEAALAHCTDPAGDGVYALDYRVIGIGDRVERWVQTYGRMMFEDHRAVAFIGAVMEITGRKRDEARLRRSEQRFRSFAENINGVLWIADPRSGEVEYVSPAYDKIWGEARGSFPATLDHWKKTVHPDDLAYAASVLDRAAQGEVLTYEYRVIRPDDTTLWIRDTTFPIRNEEGMVHRIAGVAHNITRHSRDQVYLIGASHDRGSSLAMMLRDAGYELKTFASMRAFLNVAPVLMMGCALVDLEGMDRGDLPLLRQLRGPHAAIPVIMLGAARDDISIAVSAMRAGATDYIPRPFGRQQLIDAVESAVTSIDQVVLRSQAEDRASGRLARLSHRERQVLDGVLAGGTNKTVARSLGLSPRTVELHRRNMMEKLGAKTLGEAIEIALAAGLRLSVSEQAPRSAT